MTDVSGPAALAVWGSPVAHSLSPELHTAAYAVLGLPWSYTRREVDAEGLDDALADLGPEWRGLSLTMPLKERAFAAAARRDRRAELTGAVNTLRLSPDAGPHGVNTDVGGLVGALRELGVSAPDVARLIGAGATASSAIVALGELGTRRVDVCARRLVSIAPLVSLGYRIGVDVHPYPLGTTPPDTADVTISTLPGGTVLAPELVASVADAGGSLLDVAYSPWPSALADAWSTGGARVMSGLPMLLHQALLQVRFFVSGDVEAPLPDEHAVFAAMRSALMGD
ncbi:MULTISPECIES: shikimate dehydrogenase family protein [Bacteria]